MARGAMTRTSQTNTDEFLQAFTPWLEEGRDVVYVSLSSGISGTYNAALLAARALKEKFPQRNVYIVDSLGASSGYGLLMEELADLRDNGMGAEELARRAEQMRLFVHHWFFSTDLTYYVRGGRISRAMGWFGTVLRICPLLNMDNLGRLIPRRKVRTKPRVIQEIARTMCEHAQGGTAYFGPLLYLSCGLSAGCACRQGAGGGTHSRTARQSADLRHRHHHRGAYGPRYRRPLLFGGRAERLKNF